MSIQELMEDILTEEAMAADPVWSGRILKALKAGYAEGGVFGLLDAAYGLELKAPNKLLARILKQAGKRGELDGMPLKGSPQILQNVVKYAEKLFQRPDSEPAFA